MSKFLIDREEYYKITEENNSLKEKYKNLKLKYEMYSKIQDAKSKENKEDFVNEIKELSDKIKKLNTDIKNISKENSTLKTANTNLISANEKIEKEKEKLQKQNLELKNNKAELNNQITTYKSEIYNLEQKLKQQETTEIQITNNIDTYENGISICISAYNAEKYIKETLISIKNQTWFKNHDNWECIIGIDGCVSTYEYIKLIMNEFDESHFHFYMMNSNKGTYITSNTIMSKIAKYDWCLRFDSDDIMHSNMIETVMNNISSEFDIIRYYLQNFPDKNYTLNDTSKIHKSYISYGSICVNHKKFNEFGGYLSWTCSGDAEFLQRTRKFLKQKRLENILYNRRLTNTSLTNSEKTNINSNIRKQYDSHIKNVSDKIQIKNEAINDIEINEYYKIKPYEFIISLTSYPDRIKYVKSVLESIINTNVDKNIYKIIFVLSLEEFSNKENDLPQDLVEYCDNNNIEIIWYKSNIRSHKKLIPTLQKYPSMPILVIDDDVIRTEDWLKMFINDRRKYPEDILCMRCDEYITKELNCIHDRKNFENTVNFEELIYNHRPSNGCGGTLYPPYTFTDIKFFDESLIMKLSPSSDEMWQFCFNIMQNQRIRRTSNTFELKTIPGTQQKSLYKENKEKYNLILHSLLDYFPTFKNNLILKLNEKENFNKHDYCAIIALTSWKKRINTVYKTINCLNKFSDNNHKYKIVLTLSVEEFPNKEKDLPNNLTKLINEDFEILWVRKNYKCFKKILFAMSKYNLPIISADDDIIYKYNYVNELYDNWKKNKNNILSEGFEIQYIIKNEVYKFSHGCATIFPPKILLNSIKYINDDIINTQNDDSFYGIYCRLNNIKINYIHNNLNTLIEQHTNEGAITENVKNRENFYKDKLVILNNITKYETLHNYKIC